jgi:peptidoglycan/LPS O-acetylase OafA/YrhL
MQGDSPVGMLCNFLVVGAVSVVFGTVTYRLVEKPALMVARKYKSGK